MGNCLRLTQSNSQLEGGKRTVSQNNQASKKLDVELDLDKYDYNIHEYVTKDFFRKGASSSLSIVLNTKKSRLFIIRELDITDFGEGEKNLVINEIKIHARCESDNILEFCGFHRDQMKLSILLEHMETNLAKVYNTKLFSGEHLNDDLINRVFAACVKGISYLHHQFDVPHKDLRPNNILLNKDMSKVKIAGFGTFKLIERTDTIKMMDPTEM